MAKIVKAQYPEDIATDPSYEFRHVKFEIWAPKNNADARAQYDSIMSKARGLAKTGTDVITGAIAKFGGVDMEKYLAKGTVSAGEFWKGDLNSVIVLPLPNSFSDSQGHEWNAETSVQGTLAMKVAEADYAGISANKILGQISAATATRRPVADPGYFQNYSGTKPRNFNMSFDFIPQSAQEAKQILSIITYFKIYGSPSMNASGITLMAPFYFDITMANPVISRVAKINQVVLTNIQVDYGADGAMQQTADGMPKHITLALSFAELRVTMADDYVVNEVTKTNSKGTQTNAPFKALKK